MRDPKFWKAYFWVSHPLQKLSNYHGRQSTTLLMRSRKKFVLLCPLITSGTLFISLMFSTNQNIGTKMLFARAFGYVMKTAIKL